MKVRIKDVQEFNSVFGAECFLKNWPELLTTGVEAKRLNAYGIDVVWLVDDNGRPFNQTTFFSDDEMLCMEMVE